MYCTVCTVRAGMGGAAGNRAAAAAEGSGGSQIEHTFGRPMVLAKLGQYIMDIKVRYVVVTLVCGAGCLRCVHRRDRRIFFAVW